MNLPDSLLFSLKKIGFEKATSIQTKAIPQLLDDRDLLACSETGSGKTAAYCIPMLKKLIEDHKQRALVLAPTRELAQQIYEFLQALMQKDNKIGLACLVGGQDIRKQFRSLQKNPRIVVATPGRLIDHLNRNTLQIQKVGYLVLDEGDRMIDMGFAPQLKEILQFLPEQRQTCFFTATLDKKVQALAQKYLKDPVMLQESRSKPVNRISQKVLKVQFKDKDESVLNEINTREGSVIVFLKTKHRTDRLKQYLKSYGVSVDLIHGGCTQGQRNKAIKNFKLGKTRVLCATDIAARGLDVPQVEHVINFDLPMQDEDFVHRVGRTARNGADGEALSFVTPDEHRNWNRLAKKYDLSGLLLDVPIEKSKNKKRFSKKSSFKTKKSTFRSKPKKRSNNKAV